MAVTVTTDLVVRHAMDAIASAVGIGGVSAPVAADTQSTVQGTGSLRSRHNAAGIGGTAGQFTAADFSKLHVYVWLNVLNPADTKANGGWRIRVSASASETTNFGEWTVGGNDTQVNTNKGFVRFCADANGPFNFVTGTPAALTAISSIGGIINALNFSGRETFFIDAVDTATGITVGGGGVGTEGKSSEIASNDRTNGRGIFQNVIGAYYVLGRVTIGDTVAANASKFTDSNEVWIFEDQPVSATFHRVELVGTAGVGAKNANFGTKSGIGVAAEGAGGNTFKSTGLAPFTLQAIQSGITVGLFGCSFINPVALMEDAPRAAGFATAADAFTFETRAVGNATANDFSFMPAVEAVNDKWVIGHEEPFSQIKIAVGTAGTVGAVAWEYWNGTAWVALTSLTDATTGFTVLGTNLVTYAIPDDWATTTLGTVGPYYYIRARVTTVYTVQPLGTQAFCVMGGRVRLEQANAEAIRCTFTNMDTIRVRNGAFLKKCTITNSVAPAKSAALDLGSADPAVDTVRDLTIQNCSKGILLKGTSVGATTYNFRNLKFSNNTNDVRVDFPAAATITINVLEGGGTPTIDNVNASTVVVNNTVTVKVTVQDSVSFAVLQNVRVLLEAKTGGPLPAGAAVTITRVGATATVAHTAHGLKNGQKVKIKGAVQTEYNGIFTIANVSVNAYDYTVTGTPATPATGTITSTAVLLSGLTDVNGVIQDTGFNFTSNQPVTGRARKSTATPFYRQSSIVGDITAAGFTNVTLLVLDE